MNPKRLAPEPMIAGYERLSEVARRGLGADAHILCEGGMYWLVDLGWGKQCLGRNEGYAESLLGDIIEERRNHERRERDCWELSEKLEEDYYYGRDYEEDYDLGYWRERCEWEGWWEGTE
jgi:hypothetical protein